MLKRSRLAVLVVLIAALGLVSCEELGDIDPVETACALCEILDESGICDMIQTLEEDCKEGETLVLTNVNAALKTGAPLGTDCR
jgi:hypothetical protein